MNASKLSTYLSTIYERTYRRYYYQKSTTHNINKNEPRTEDRRKAISLQYSLHITLHTSPELGASEDSTSTGKLPHSSSHYDDVDQKCQIKAQTWIHRHHGGCKPCAIKCPCLSYSSYLRFFTTLLVSRGKCST